MFQISLHYIPIILLKDLSIQKYCQQQYTILTIIVLLQIITYFDVFTLVSHVALLIVVVQNLVLSSNQYFASIFRSIKITLIYYQFYCSKMLVFK